MSVSDTVTVDTSAIDSEEVKRLKNNTAFKLKKQLEELDESIHKVLRDTSEDEENLLADIDFISILQNIVFKIRMANHRTARDQFLDEIIAGAREELLNEEDNESK